MCHILRHSADCLSSHQTIFRGQVITITALTLRRYCPARPLLPQTAPAVCSAAICYGEQSTWLPESDKIRFGTQPVKRLYDVRCAPSQASAGTASLTVSSWPTVSLPKSTGINAPIATTAKIVPKKIVAEPVCGSIRYGASTPANKRPVDSPKGCPRPRSAVGNCSE